MQFISQNWGWIVGILSIVGVSGGAIYKISIRDSVSKHELYKKDGQPIYQHRSNCDKIMTSYTAGLNDIKETLEAMDEKLQHDRITTFMFMSAVKECLKLDFTLPKS